MNTIHTYIQNYGAAVFLYILGLLFAIVIAIEMVYNQPINQVATGYIGLVIGYAINSHGVQQGTNTTNDTVAKTAAAQLPLVQQQETQMTTQIAENSTRLDVLEKKRTP